MNNVSIDVNGKIRGRFRLCVLDGLTGDLKEDTGWFDNLITNQGMDWKGMAPPNNNVSYGQLIIGTHCGVGTGTTTPAVTDTQLTSFLAMHPPSTSQNVEGFSSSSYVAGPPAYWSGIRTYNFAIGAVVGNIAEVGIGNTASTDTQPQLATHALIIVSGSPGTISVTSSDALVVYHEERLYLDLTDHSYSFNISGTPYSGIYRRASVTTVPQYSYVSWYTLAGTYPAFIGYNGSIGAVTTKPSGSSSNPNDVPCTHGTYTAGTYTISMQAVVGLTKVNFAGGITAFTLSSNHGSFQFSVSPAIPKTSLYTLTMNWNISWARYP
jgi:hypothetical protein